MSQAEASLIAPRTLDKSEESSSSLYLITDRVITWTKDSASLLERSNTFLCLIAEERSLGGQWASHTRASRACNAHLLRTATVPVTPSHTTTHRSIAWICMTVSGGSLRMQERKGRLTRHSANLCYQPPTMVHPTKSMSVRRRQLGRAGAEEQRSTHPPKQAASPPAVFLLLVSPMPVLHVCSNV